MEKRIRIGIVFGGRSGEHEVSLASAASVIQALDPERFSVVLIGITREGRWISSPDALLKLMDRRADNEVERVLLPEPHRQGLIEVGRSEEEPLKVDVVFPLVHGTLGEDGSLQGLLEMADVPYVGAGVLASAVGLDKVLQKQIFGRARLPIALHSWFTAAEWKLRQLSVIRRVEASLIYPVFVKPANTGSSVGISKARDRRELRAAVGIALEYDRKVIVEQAIRGAKEIECSVLGNDDPVASVLGEIIPSNEFYDYDAKYVDGKSTSIVPAELPKRVTKRIRELAVQAFRAVDCAGMARVDFFVTRGRNRIVLNELNTLPGFTLISMYPKLWEASGIPYHELLERLVELAFERHREKGTLKRSFPSSREWYR
ncbi:MAG: D-alanine--D-alanine ligase family protein [Bacteroidota bacterium]